MDRCDKCHELILDIAGECFCMEFLIVDDEGEFHNWFADSAKKAAMSFAQYYNEDGGYSLINSEIEITVDGVPYLIGAHADVHYSANEVKDK